MPFKHIPSPVPEGFKWCHKCAQAKPRGSFYVDRGRPDGRSYCCRRCKLRTRAAASINREAFARLYVRFGTSA